MNKEEFAQYLDENSSVHSIFAERAIAYQQKKNQARQPAKRWRDEKVERAAEKMYDDVFNNIYDMINKAVKDKNWAEFIEDNDILENLEESVTEMEFE